MIMKFLPIGFLLSLLFVISFAQEKKDLNKQSTETMPKPVSYGIVVDNSGSYRMMLEKIVQAVKDIVEENKTDDETFLVRFVDSEKIRLLQDITDSKSQIQDAADEMFIEGGPTAILDAVNFSAKYLAENANADSDRSKVLILITDGDDRQNKIKIDEVLKFLKTEKIQIYAIGLSDEKVSTKLLDKLTKENSGKVYTPRNPAEIKTAIKELTATMRVR